MDNGFLEQQLEEARGNYPEDRGPLEDVLENGETICEETNNTVFHSSEVLPSTVTKVFYGEHPEDIRTKIERAHPDYFPEALVEVVDTSKIENPDILTKKENGVVVLEERSQNSVLDIEDYKTALQESVEFVDGMVEHGQIIDDFKAEEIHEYEDGLKYVDFEDKDAIKNWPLLSDPSSVQEITQRMALMYANLAVGFQREYDVDMEEVKEDIAYDSEIINLDVYDNKGFVPEMVGYWSFEP